ncbi:MAG: type restriction enzyme subunit, partial [Methanosarcinales archaeon]|nr:type restriction enzyme subunit [Methanosarcinales archaeon]
LLTEGVKPPKGINEYREYFVGDNSEEKQQLRLEFYKRVSSLVRAYTNIANELTEAGYSKKEQEEIKEKVRHYTAIRGELKLMSGDYLDLKVFDPAMRYLIDSYIQAEESRTLASFEDTSLLEIIVLKGLQKALETLPSAIGKNKEALAETIENNIRRLIVDKREVNPAYYDKMSKILKELVEKRKKEVISYEEYLKEVEELTKMLINRESGKQSYPPSIRNSMAKRAIYDNLKGIENREELTNAIDEAIRKTKKDNWRGHKIKERQAKNAIRKILKDEELTEKIFQIVLKQGEY